MNSFRSALPAIFALAIPATFAATPSPSGAAPDQAPPSPTSTAENKAAPPDQAIRPMPEGAGERTDRKLIGREIRGADGEKLGELQDFLIEPRTGRVAFAIVKSGGMVKLDKIRLVPFRALQPGEDKQAFRLTLNRSEWDALPVIADGDLQNRTIAVTDSDRRQIEQAFKLAAAPARPSDPAPYIAELTAHLIRATDLHGKAVRGDSGKLGEIEALVLDQKSGTAVALFEPHDDVTGTAAKYLVPLAQLGASGGREPAATRLTAADFRPQEADAATARATTPTTQPGSAEARVAQESSRGVQPSPAEQANRDQQNTAGGSQGGSIVAGAAPETLTGAGQQFPAANSAKAGSSVTQSTPSASTKEGQVHSAADAERSKPLVANNSASAQHGTTTAPSKDRTDEPPLTPTGATSADQTAGASDGELISAARAARKALDSDPALARLDVRVVPENGRIVVRGTVADETARRSVEQTVRDAAGGKEVDAELQVGRASPR